MRHVFEIWEHVMRSSRLIRYSDKFVRPPCVVNFVNFRPLSPLRSRWINGALCPICAAMPESRRLSCRSPAMSIPCPCRVSSRRARMAASISSACRAQIRAELETAGLDDKAGQASLQAVVSLALSPRRDRVRGDDRSRQADARAGWPSVSLSAGPNVIEAQVSLGRHAQMAAPLR